MVLGMKGVSSKLIRTARLPHHSQCRMNLKFFTFASSCCTNHIAAIGLEGRKRSVVVFEECEGGIAYLAEIIGDEIHIDVEASHGTADEINTVASAWVRMWFSRAVQASSIAASRSASGISFRPGTSKAKKPPTDRNGGGDLRVPIRRAQIRPRGAASRWCR